MEGLCMLCDDCHKRNAVIHMTKLVQGKKQEVHLCEICAQSKELNNLAKDFSIHNFLANLLDTNLNSHLNIPNYSGIHCHRCGTTFYSFKQTGRLGCDLCYEVFNERINPLLRRVHGSTQHLGKIPKRSSGDIRLKRELKQLKNKLQQAIDSEAYEQAAEIRDQIKKLEDQINTM